MGALAAFEGWVYWAYSPDCVGIYKSRSDGSETTFLPTHVRPNHVVVNSTHAFVFDDPVSLVVSMPR